MLICEVEAKDVRFGSEDHVGHWKWYGWKKTQEGHFEVLFYLNDSTLVLTGTQCGLLCVVPDLIKYSEFTNVNLLWERVLFCR